MRNIEDVIVNKVLLSIMDLEKNNTIISKEELEITEEVATYFEKHILKVISSDLTFFAKFNLDENRIHNACKEIIIDENKFVDLAAEITNTLIKTIKSSEKLENERSADIAICLFEALNGKYIAIMKLDYNISYTHQLLGNREELNVSLATDTRGLPSLTQKVAKVAIIDTKENKMLLTDRELDGYFCENFLNCSRIMDDRAQTKIIREATESFARKTFKDNAQEAEGLRQNIATTLSEENTFDVNDFADKVFNTIELKEEYKEHLVAEGMTEETVEIDRAWAEKKLKRKRLKMNNEMELYIDSEVYNDKEKFEIKRNGDGSINIILKNIRQYIEK